MRPSPLLLALVVLAPALMAAHAAAQTGLLEPRLQVSVEDPARALVPSRNETIPGRVTYQVPLGAQPAPDPSRENGTRWTRVDLQVVQAPSWVLAAHVWPPFVELEIPPEGVAGRVVQASYSVNLTLDPAAPAFRREPIVVEAIAAENGNLAGKRAQSPDINLRANFVSNVTVAHAEGASVVVAPGGRWIRVPFALENHGNGDVEVKLNVTLRPEHSQVRFPPSILLAHGERRIVEVEVRLPWTEAEAGTLELEAFPVFDGDVEGVAALGAVEVEGRSAVPPGGLAAALAAVALAGRLAAPRRRR